MSRETSGPRNLAAIESFKASMGPGIDVPGNLRQYVLIECEDQAASMGPGIDVPGNRIPQKPKTRSRPISFNGARD